KFEEDKMVTFHCSNLPRSFLKEAEITTHPIISDGKGAEKSFGAIQGRIPAESCTFLRIETDDINGKIKGILGEGRYTEDSLQTFGGYGVLQILHLQKLFTAFSICLLMVKCISVNSNIEDLDKKRVILYISIFLSLIPHSFNYILGQINLFVTFFLLISIYFFKTKTSLYMEILGGICLGISIIIKPITIFIVPFVILLNIDLKNKKIKIDFFRSILRLVG
ncbi:unnamed protein product, partial [marine sediment metagenome]